MHVQTYMHGNNHHKIILFPGFFPALLVKIKKKKIKKNKLRVNKFIIIHWSIQISVIITVTSVSAIILFNFKCFSKLPSKNV